MLKSEMAENKQILDSLGSVNLQKASASRTSDLLMNHIRVVPTNVTSKENFEESRQVRGSHVFGRVDPMVLRDNDEVELQTNPTEGLLSKEMLLASG